MKVNPKFLIMMAALVGGSALAAPAPLRTDNLTNSGTVITNTATANFTDPATGNPYRALNATKDGVDSNEVTTTVQDKQAFNITYSAGGDSATTKDVAGAPAGYQTTNVVPGQWVAFEYVAVNNGNAKQTITLSTDVKFVDPATVKYYSPSGTFTVNAQTGAVTNGTELPKLGSNYQIQNLSPSGDDPATTPVVEVNTGLQTFWMVYQVPQIAPNTAAGATPIGTAKVWDSVTKANVTATEQKDVVAATATYDDLWWQYNSVKTVKTDVTTTPKDPGTVKTVTPPVGPGFPSDPTNPVSPPTTPVKGDDPSVSGYVDPNNPKTSIAVSGNDQIAYPPADTDAVVDSVTFKNTVTNSSPLDDVVTLSVVTNTNADPAITQVVTRTDATHYTIVQTNKDGTTTTANVTLSNATPKVDANKSVDYTVTVTYPDLDTTDSHPIIVKIGVDSGNDNDTTPDAYTTDTIMPPSMQFGDPKTGVAADPTLVSVQIKDPGQTATFPMDVANTGEYNDTYYLSGYVVVPLADGTKQIVPVNYSGTDVQVVTGVTRTVKVDFNLDGDFDDLGETVTVPVYVTKVVNANSEISVNADVVVPDGAAYTYNTAGLAVQQQATANYSGIVEDDINDLIKINSIGGVKVTKFTAKSGAPSETFNGISGGLDFTANPTTAVPNDELTYKIIAKNNYNSPAASFFLMDSLRTNTNFGSVLGSSSVTGATIIYSTNGTLWSTTAPTTGTDFYVALDDAATAGNQPGNLPANAELTMTFKVTVK